MVDLTREQIEREVLKMDPGLKPDDEAVKAQVIMLASVQIGPNIKKLIKFTGYPPGLVHKFGHNLRKNGVWHGRRVRANWFDEGGYIDLLLDTNVALGYLERASPKPAARDMEANNG